jgi:hypothetical protein
MHSITYRFGRLHASSVRCHWAVCTCMPGGRPCGRHPFRRQLPCQDSPAFCYSASDLHWVRLPILNRYSKPAAVPATYSPRVHPWALAIYTRISNFPERLEEEAFTYVSDDRGHLWRGSELETICLRVGQIGVDSDEYRHMRSASEYTPGYVFYGL